MKKRLLPGLILCLSLLVQVGGLVVPVNAANEPEPDTYYPEVYQQTDPRWSGQELIGSNGCGLLSLVNAVNYITGSFIDPVELAVYAHRIDAYNGSVGGGTARWVLYHQLQKYERRYGFKVVQTGKDAGVSHKDFVKHLKDGGVAVCHVYGHFIAIVGYNEQEKTYLVYDSAANPDRRHTTADPTWLSETYLSTSPYMTVDWWCLISATESSENSVGGRVYADRCAPASIRTGADCTVTLAGQVMTSRGVASLSYVLDYAYDRIIPVPDAFRVDPDTRKSFSVDVNTAGLEQGQHTLRLIANTPDGGRSDIAEYTLFIGDGTDGIDPATGDLVLGMSGFLGQDGVVSRLASTGYDCPMLRADVGTVLFLGDVDVSSYKTVEVAYATRSGFDADKKGVTGLIGLKSQRSSYGCAGEAYNMSGSLACAEMTDPVEGESGVKHFRVAVLDVADLTYNGSLYLSLYTPYHDTIIIKSVRFCTGNEPATEPPTEPTAEPATEPVTQPATEPATQPVTQPATQPVTDQGTAPNTLDEADPTADIPAASEVDPRPAVAGCGAAVSITAVGVVLLALFMMKKKD